MIPNAARLVTVSLLLLLAVAVIVRQSFYQHKYWEDNFDDVSLENLKQSGWEIWDIDSVAFNRQNKPGFFTAYTERGDYWVTRPDYPIIPNLIVKRIAYESAKVTVKINDFNPTQDYQQAGVILLNKNMDRAHNIRITFASCQSDVKTDQIVQIIKQERGLIYEKNCPIRQWSVTPPETASTTPIWLQIQFKNNRFLFYYHDKFEHSSFIEIGEFDFEFDPYYVAIGAFRGIRDSKRDLNGSESIPAFFDYVKIERL